jgi:hypothetical protein
MKRVMFVILTVLGILGAKVALGQGGFVHPGGSMTFSDGTAGQVHPGGAITFSDGTSGFVHPGGAVTTSDGRTGFLHPGGALDLPPKPQKEIDFKPDAEPSKKPTAKEKTRKPPAKEEIQKEYLWEEMPKTKRSPEQPAKAKFIEIHSDGTVTESYH